VAKVTQKQIEMLRSYLEGSGPNSDGEWGMRCPLHDDNKRSASLNTERGVWFCQACELGGSVAMLIKQMKELGAEEPSNDSGEDYKQEEREPFPYNDNHVRAWVASLHANARQREDFIDRRGIASEVLDEYEIGWDDRSGAYTIPVRDHNGNLTNIRFYQLDPADERRKIWGVKGHGEPSLYPVDHLLEEDPIIICEGELDALVTWQYGFNTITRTGAADVWKPEWSKHFAGREVYLCHDADAKGQKANAKIRQLLKSVASAVYEITLPYEVSEKHGKDLSDFFLDGYDDRDLETLMQAAKQAAPEPPDGARGVVDVRVVDSMGVHHYGSRMRMRVTVTGKRNPPYMLPKDVHFSCSMDAGAKCKFCPLNDLGGYLNREILGDDEVLLSLMNSTETQVRSVLRERSGIQKCSKLEINVQAFQPVEELYVRPSIDQQLSSRDPGDYTSRRVFSTSSHSTKTNSTIELVGTVHPNPKNQMNEFMAWDVEEVETDIDKFVMSADTAERLKVFQNPDPLYGLDLISEDLSANVTKIYGRSTMHAFMDLVFHSVLGFRFLDEDVRKGWLDGMIVGDTRTGKSEAADRMRQHYGLGEMITCESASFAGVVGGVQQFSSNVWEVSWGSIPLNDRRMVVLDEVSGLTPEEIAQMSSIRSSGEAQITKIKSERTLARTRLLWIGNPRNAKMQDFTYGVYSIKPLVGNNEDVARFDMAMAVLSDDVDPEAINTRQHKEVEHVYTSELCKELLLWCWSRTPDQVVWAKGSEQDVLDKSLSLAREYKEDPPLVQGANVRIKLARIAVAIAARLFSTDRTYQKVVVRRCHVVAAYEFIKTLYDNERFGYWQVSDELRRDEMIAQGHVAEAEAWAWSNTNATKLMKTRPSFRRSDLEDVLNVSREEANGIVNMLWDWRMIRRDGADNIPVQVFQKILREVVT
jgi:5S rRNA maturation endonuclease (ribonuclease M5)